MELKHKNIKGAMLAFNQKITVAYSDLSRSKDCLEKGPETSHGLLLYLKKVYNKSIYCIKILLLIAEKRIK